MKNVKKFLLFITLLIMIVFFVACEKKTITIGNKTLDATKIYTIYIAQSISKQTLDDMRKGFVVGLKDLGLVEDVNIKYIYENANAEPAYADKIVKDINEKNPDLVVAIGDIVASKIYEKCKDIKAVFLGCADADRLGICDANGNPLGNMTGVRDSHLIEEQIEYIKTNYPSVKKLGIIYNPDRNLSAYDVDYFKFYADKDIDIYTATIKKSSDVERALDAIMPKIDAMALVIDDTVEKELSKIVARCRKDNKPLFGRDKENDADGVIISKIVDMRLVGNEGAKMANDILVNGKEPKEIKIIDVDFK